MHPTTTLGRPPSLDRLAAIARALAHPARLRMLELLCEREGCMGRQLVAELGLAPSTVSEHLRILREAGLVTAREVPPARCFVPDPDALAPLQAFLEGLRRSRGSLCDPLDEPETGDPA